MRGAVTTEDYYDRYWQQGVAGWDVEAPLTPHTRQFLTEAVTGKDVLDFGGGNGERYGSVIRSAARSVTVADVSPAVLELRERAGDRTVHVDDLPGAAAEFDVVLFLEVLEHLLDPLAGVRLGASKLRPGGQVVISVPNAFSWPNRLRMLAGRLPASGVGGAGVRGRTYIAPHIRFFDVPSLLHLVQEAGLEVTSVQTDARAGLRFATPRQATAMRPVGRGLLSSLTAETLVVTATRT
jgi:2-polyprenyl-3-methyl-5-hydroxy-6-metoxy-1,4-benzoquinol methylase